MIILALGCVNTEEQKKVNDYTKRLEEWNTYFTEVMDLILEGDEVNRNLIENFEMAKNNDQQIPYAKILLINYQIEYEEALKIKVPDIVKEEHKHFLEYLTQNIKAPSCVIDYDPSGYNEAASRAFDEYTEFFNEIIIIWEDFDKEAEELGLPIPSQSIIE